MVRSFARSRYWLPSLKVQVEKKVEDFKLELEGSSSNHPKNLWTPVRVQLCDAEKAADFIAGVIPADLKKEFEEAQKTNPELKVFTNK